jgi:ribonuclease HI
LKALLFVDGACRGNPGPMACGWVVYDAVSRCKVGEGACSLGKGTNNQAEYKGVRRGLVAVVEAGYDEVEVLTDSELVAHQLTGRWAVRNVLLMRLVNVCRLQLRSFRVRSVTWIPRESNKEADELAQQELGL